MVALFLCAENFCKGTSFSNTCKLFFHFFSLFVLCFLFLADIQVFLFAIQDNDAAGEDEEVVGQAVEVAEDDIVDLYLAGECDDTTLGAAADGTGNMALGAREVATGDDKILQLRQLVHDKVDLAFEHLDFFLGKLGEAGIDVLVLGGQKGLEGEEVVLDSLQFVVVAALEGTNHFGEEANVRVEFVDGAVGLYAMVVFIHAAAAHEGGGATVAGFGVDHVTVKV